MGANMQKNLGIAYFIEAYMVVSKIIPIFGISNRYKSGFFLEISKQQTFIYNFALILSKKNAVLQPFLFNLVCL